MKATEVDVPTLLEHRDLCPEALAFQCCAVPGHVSCERTLCMECELPVRSDEVKSIARTCAMCELRQRLQERGLEDAWTATRTAEIARVKALGDEIGYGRTMQLCEELWRGALAASGLPHGGEHTVGPCAAFMVACPCPETGRDDAGHCEWCAGSRRVTRFVAAVIAELEERRLIGVVSSAASARQRGGT